jgi:predicted CXXCH cytochrome family protein
LRISLFSEFLFIFTQQGVLSGSKTLGTELLKKLLLALAAATLIVVAIVAYMHKDYGAQPGYVTSEACQHCHQSHYTAWKGTLHPYQFRPVTDPNELLGDFESDDPALTFSREDVEMVIGNKWEQVYARKVDGEYYPLPAKWYITTQRWVPYKVNDWKQTPLSTKCDGCHTTGYNPDTFEFAEYGIGCEACHGAGAQHVANTYAKENLFCELCHDAPVDGESDIVNSVNSAVCGQCHSRGKEKRDSEHLQTVYNFPINYLPGDELNSNYQPLTQEQDAKGKYWWGNGLAKNRHQEYADFAKSKHAKSLRYLHENHTPERGEITEKCLNCHSADYRLAKEGDRPNLESVKHGITCAVCHEPHGMDRQFLPERKRTEICGSCHLDSMDRMAVKRGRPHMPCPTSAATCADCHMPYIVKSGGDFVIRSHAFQIVPPTATEAFGVPNSCQNGGCHADKDIAWAISAYAEHYPEAVARLQSADAEEKD